MKVFVLGAGVTGISTAYYLAQDGHEVTVIDRQPGAAMEASAASGGEILNDAECLAIRAVVRPGGRRRRNGFRCVEIERRNGAT